MKILLISNKSPWPARDGGSSATLSMITGLKLKGASVTVLAINTLKHYVDINELPEDIAKDLHLVGIDSGIKPAKLLFNLLFSDQPYSLVRFESEDFKWKIRTIIGNNYDIIQVEGLAMACYMPFIRNLTKCRIVFRPHNVENLIWNQLADEENNLLKRYYFRMLASRTKKAELSIMNKFDALTAMTHKDLEWYINSGLNIPSFVSPPGPLIPANTTDSQIFRSVFFIGALDWLPNINGLKWFIQKVWPLIHGSLPGVTFHIAGRNPSGRVRKICRGEGIFFYGEVESSTDFIRDKAVMVVPLFSGSGIRIKILEGMRMGKSIVATSTAAEGLDYEEGKNIFITDDATSFARHITDLLEDDNLRNATGMNAIENVRKNYNILASADNLLKFYNHLP